MISIFDNILLEDLVFIVMIKIFWYVWDLILFIGIAVWLFQLIVMFLPWNGYFLNTNILICIIILTSFILHKVVFLKIQKKQKLKYSNYMHINGKRVIN